MAFFTEIFAWWTGNTWGTRLWTWRKGVKVGADDYGNVYYGERNGARRWVIYSGGAEASKVPPEWHGWLHHTVDDPPDGDYRPRDWQKPHRENMTGTSGAYRPVGSTLVTGGRPPATGDYQAWKPDQG